MNTSLQKRLFIAACVLLLVSCNVDSPKSTATQQVAFESPESTLRYDWKTNWLMNAQCAPPCWEGIIPGKTTLPEAVEIIQKMPGVQMTGVYHNTVYWEQYQSYFGFALVSEGDNTILSIVIDFDRKQGISLQEAINVFGKPSSVQSFSCAQNICDVYVIYPELGLSLRLLLESGEYAFTIAESSEIVGIKFFTPGIDNYLKEPIFQAFSIREWVGYGIYSE